MYTMMTSVYSEIGVIHQSEHRLQPARIVRLSKQDKLTVTQIFEKTKTINVETTVNRHAIFVYILHCILLHVCIFVF